MHAPLLPVLALVFNAFVWGLSWWPFRHLQAAGVHPLWATGLIYSVVLAGIVLLRPQALRGFLQHPVLWLLALSSGLTNLCFNWAVTEGDVVRVVLLFYLMPAWSVLLAWKILGERPTPLAAVRLVLAFAGVALVMLPGGGDAAAHAGAHAASLPVSAWSTPLSRPDLLALAGGFFFALTNVTLRRLSALPGDARMLSMFTGCALLSALAALAGTGAGLLPGLPAPTLTWLAIAGGLGLAFLLGNYALQYGAARLAAGQTALIMLSEVVFASVSSVLLTQTVLSGRTLAGGALIMLAALLACLPQRRATAAAAPAS